MSQARSDNASSADPSATAPCAVIGAGPAGISAAMWLACFDVPFAWLAQEGKVGGLLERVNNTVTNFPGGCYESGVALAQTLAKSLRECEVAGPSAGRLASACREDGRWHLQFEARPALSCEVVILATGTRYRRLGVPGESEGMGTCVSQSATADAGRVAGEHVAVVGGGDAGFENALILAEHGCRVRMLLRSPDFRARPAFVERVQASPDIEIAPIPTVVEGIEPREGGCRLELDVDGRPTRLDVACLFVRIGVDPVVPALSPEPQMRDGFLVVDSHQRTSLDGLLAAGDVTDCLLRSVATAVGSGATAARAAAASLGCV